MYNESFEGMFEFILVARSLGIINQYFSSEAIEGDFWDAPEEVYNSLREEEKKNNWFMINPQKLNEKYRESNEALIVTEREKSSILKAFEILNDYSKELPDNSSFKERLLIAKGQLPHVFFSSNSKSEECKIIPFKMDND